MNENVVLSSGQSPLMDVIKTGGLICIVAGFVDNLILALANSQNWQGWTVWLAFIVFVGQTGLLSAFVGLKSRDSMVWWAFFGWSLLLINLMLTFIGLLSTWINWQTTMAFGFFTAQIGLVVFWGVLGNWDWRKRIPMAGVLLLICCHPYWLIEYSNDRWLSVTTNYVTAVFLSSLILRWLGFRLIPISPLELREGTQAEGQFTIRHLFVWTTVVALLFGVGRFVNWERLSYRLSQDAGILGISRSILMTLITVATAWAIMGRTKTMLPRALGLVLILIALGFGLFVADLHSGWWGLGGTGNVAPGSPWSDHLDSISIWVGWTVLNGLFFSGLITVFRVSGTLLLRTKNKNQLA